MTGGAWLSSARVVKCRVKSRNERNPCLLLLIECLRETADQHRRKVWMMSSQHAPYILGYTRTTMVGTMSCDPAKASQSQKPYLSSDCTLQLEYMKVESLVIAGQHTAVNTFQGLVHTARHTMEVDPSLSRYSNLLGRGCRRQGW